MSQPGTKAPGGDQVRVSVALAVPQDVAFEIFTTEIDRWWLTGPCPPRDTPSPSGHCERPRPL